MHLSVKPKTVAKVLLFNVAFLVSAHTFAMIMKHGFGHGRLLGLSKLFNMRYEYNIPTLYSILTLFTCACVLFLIGKTTPVGASNKPSYWYGLAVIFLFLSADEYLQIHENIGHLTYAIHPTEGIFYYAWVIPYAILVGIFALTYLGFLLRLPARFSIRFVLAGAIFVTGALVLEALGGKQHFEGAFETIPYIILSTLEETLELLGVALFIIFLVQYLTEEHDGLVIRFDDGPY